MEKSVRELLESVMKKGKEKKVVKGREYFYKKKWYVEMRKFWEKKCGRELSEVGVGDGGWVREVFDFVKGVLE